MQKQNRRSRQSEVDILHFFLFIDVNYLSHVIVLKEQRVHIDNFEGIPFSQTVPFHPWGH